MAFEFERLAINDVILVKPRIFGDERGFFMETYKKSEFAKNGINVDFCQDNHSKSFKGVLRGLHYQAAPKAQAKLVRCVRGKIFDVVVDLRKNSQTFGKWVGAHISEKNRHMIFVPVGFAHGFVVLSDEAELMYKTTGEYAPEFDRGLLWNDSDIGIDWGIDFEPLLSEKDKKQPRLRDINLKEVL